MPQNCTAELYAFMSQCWKSEPRMRPDIFQIVSSMQEKLINNSVSKKQTFFSENTNIVIYHPFHNCLKFMSH